ncbi:hypothetical protein RGQ29_028987 [Quercus rubra]|uniref:CASP-like protein n=1 Tax=Quercus rubra TaxID=3512 RepID=A0AAN7EUF7_QUERU|nr:hypothetical protein RGQ29_028987 [Quercus rubra]
MAEPTSSASQIAILSLKVFTSVLLLISLIVLTTDTSTAYYGFLLLQVQFDNVNSYRCMLASNVVGFVYILMQITFSVCHIIMGKRLISGNGSVLLDFYCDKVISYLLGTSAVARFGATIDLKVNLDIFGFYVGKIILCNGICIS